MTMRTKWMVIFMLLMVEKYHASNVLSTLEGIWYNENDQEVMINNGGTGLNKSTFKMIKLYDKGDNIEFHEIHRGDIHNAYLVSKSSILESETLIIWIGMGKSTRKRTTWSECRGNAKDTFDSLKKTENETKKTDPKIDDQSKKVTKDRIISNEEKEITDPINSKDTKSQYRKEDVDQTEQNISKVDDQSKKLIQDNTVSNKGEATNFNSEARCCKMFYVFIPIIVCVLFFFYQYQYEVMTVIDNDITTCTDESGYIEVKSIDFYASCSISTTSVRYAGTISAEDPEETTDHLASLFSQENSDTIRVEDPEENTGNFDSLFSKENTDTIRVEDIEESTDRLDLLFLKENTDTIRAEDPEENTDMLN